MKLAIVGARSVVDPAIVFKKIDAWIAEHGKPSMIVSGGAAGVDSLAKKWADDNKIEYKEFPPKRQEHKFLLARNIEIVKFSDQVLAFPNEKSTGTWHTVSQARKRDKPVWIMPI